MNYQNLNQELNSLNFQKKYFFSIFGLYLFSLGTTILGYSVYLLLESIAGASRDQLNSIRINFNKNLVFSFTWNICKYCFDIFWSTMGQELFLCTNLLYLTNDLFSNYKNNIW